MSTSQDHITKARIGTVAASLVSDGMLVGLGTGSTAAQVVHAIGRQVLSGTLKIEAVCTSGKTELLAREYGIPILDPEPDRPLDLYLDGADEIDQHAWLIKGAGGALLREKLVAALARRRVILVDESKLTPCLGLYRPVPVEIAVFGDKTTQHRLAQLGCSVERRMDGHCPFITDEGHYIIDCRFANGIKNPQRMKIRLKATLGVIDSGLFIGCCDEVVVGNTRYVERIDIKDWPGRFQALLEQSAHNG